jgi:hypothetical protein
MYGSASKHNFEGGIVRTKNPENSDVAAAKRTDSHYDEVLFLSAAKMHDGRGEPGLRRGVADGLLVLQLMVNERIPSQYGQSRQRLDHGFGEPIIFGAEAQLFGTFLR